MKKTIPIFFWLLITFISLKSQPNIPRYENPELSFKYTIVIGSMLRLENAEKLLQLAIQNGYESFIAPVNVRNKQFHRVCVGSYESFEETKKELTKIRREFKISNAWIWHSPRITEKITQDKQENKTQPYTTDKKITPREQKHPLKTDVKTNENMPAPPKPTEKVQEVIPTPPPTKEIPAKKEKDSDENLKQAIRDLEKQISSFDKSVQNGDQVLLKQIPSSNSQLDKSIKDAKLELEKYLNEVKLLSYQAKMVLNEPSLDVLKKYQNDLSKLQIEIDTRIKNTSKLIANAEKEIAKIKEEQRKDSLKKLSQNTSTKDQKQQQAKDTIKITKTTPQTTNDQPITDKLLEEFGKEFLQFINNLRNYEYTKANSFIHPDFHFYVIYNEESKPSVREFNSFEKFFAVFSAFTNKGSALDFSSDLEKISKKNPTIAPYPIYDCQTRKYNQSGLIISKAKPTDVNLVNAVKQYYRTFNQEVLPEIIDRVQNAENNIKVSVIDTDCFFIEGFYFGYINSRWYLIALDLKFRCR